MIGEEDVEDLTAPFLVVASVEASVFVASKISSYMYKVCKSNVDKMSTDANKKIFYRSLEEYRDLMQYSKSTTAVLHCVWEWNRAISGSHPSLAA